MSLTHDWRFAELIARTWMEPALRERYLAEPRRVLAEAGIELPAGCPVPALPSSEELEVVVDRFDTLPAAAPAAAFCLSLADEPMTAVCGAVGALAA
ncbi:putative TOMM peptide [Streptomyces misionensis]|uniref:Putative TOMM peptide n=1 Tax=Streptomyces misionensis TaxID=67331 RepID=A0A1H4IAI8_9ACTN|nr:TIGR04351 family putative TOMM peptide [Streptomyces misionensis]SEB31114.1 putative TOMM peptide [Streptomyces misionensis]